MLVTENLTEYSADEVFACAGRENNKKRGSLIVNKLQAKHIPAVPSKAAELFRQLGKEVQTAISQKKGRTLVIGFAETATAIGAEIAAYLGGDCIYIHTSRENIDPSLRVADFSEEHSHASEQNLFSAQGKDIFKGIDNIVFAEDELTTGKTILNFIRVLKPLTENCRFYAASLINGMSSENIAVFDENSIGIVYLIKIDSSLKSLRNAMDVSPLKDTETGSSDYRLITADYPYDPRLGANAADYADSCKKAAEHIIAQLSDELKSCRRIDVIGTEECMLPAIYLGKELEKLGIEAFTHSTTRSPIVPSDAEGYPLNMRCRLSSFYDASRTTYIYNLFDCDMTIVTGDFSDDTGAASQLASVMRSDRKIVAKLCKRNENQ